MSKSCECGGSSTRSDSIPWERLQQAQKTAASTATSLIASLGNPALVLQTADTLHPVSGKRAGWYIARLGGTDMHAFAAIAGVVDKLPHEATFDFDLTSLRQSSQEPVIRLRINCVSPVERQIIIPFALTGVVRDAAGNIVRVGDYEAVRFAGLSDADWELIKCILACGGLALALCVWECIPLLPTWPAFLACVAACLGANAEEIMACIEACHASGALT